MQFRVILDLLGIGIIFWAIGRLFLHLSLIKKDNCENGTFLRILAIIFYILGNLSSIIIGLVDGACHKRLYRKYLSDMRELMSYFTLPNIHRNKNLEEFCSEHEIGPLDSQAPIDIPESWYSLK